jgi:hypothetical protein
MQHRFVHLKRPDNGKYGKYLAAVCYRAASWPAGRRAARRGRPLRQRGRLGGLHGTRKADPRRDRLGGITLRSPSKGSSDFTTENGADGRRQNGARPFPAFDRRFSCSPAATRSPLGPGISGRRLAGRH